MADSRAKQPAETPASNIRVVSPSELNKKFRTRPSLSSLRSSVSSSFPNSSSIGLSAFNPDPSETPYTTKPSSFLSRFRARYAALPAPIRQTARALRFLAPILPIGIFFSEHVLQVMWVRGPSMTPYLNENYAETHTESDIVLVNVWPWGSTWPWNRTRRLERGMVVTFRSPANPSNIAIKRVIALPGDRVTTREPCPRPSQIVPFNHVWLEGDADDPGKSLDSNTYGPVSISLITGSVMAVLHPRMRLLKWWEWEQQKQQSAEAETETQTTSDVQKELGEGYRTSVRDRVIKQAVKIEAPRFD